MQLFLPSLDARAWRVPGFVGGVMVPYPNARWFSELFFGASARKIIERPIEKAEIKSHGV
jgi:hypothetical protein